MQEPQSNSQGQPNDREAGMMTTAAVQGGGKTYKNMYIIRDYVVDKLDIKVRGRKCLIFDTNGEYVEEQFKKNGIENFNVRTIAVSAIKAWCADPNIVECRRIDGKHLSIAQKKEIVEYLLRIYRNGMLVLEDINTYILNVTHMEEIVGGLVNLRHRAVDVLISFQSIRAIEPRIWQNSRWVRLHFISDNIDEAKNKITNYQLFKIAQIMINERYNKGDKRFFVYITEYGRKIEGDFTKEQFQEACRRYLVLNKKLVKEHSAMYAMQPDEATNQLVAGFEEQYYANVA